MKTLQAMIRKAAQECYVAKDPVTCEQIISKLVSHETWTVDSLLKLTSGWNNEIKKFQIIADKHNQQKTLA